MTEFIQVFIILALLYTVFLRRYHDFHVVLGCIGNDCVCVIRTSPNNASASIPVIKC